MANMLRRIAGAIARRAGGSTRQPVARYMRDGSSNLLGSWAPALRDASEDVRSSWTLAAARAIDSIHNSGWISGGVDQAVADQLGAGLKLSAQPDARVLGWSSARRSSFARELEAKWRRWSQDPIECDLRGVQTVAQMADTNARWNYGYGESVALLPIRRRPESASAVKIMMVPAYRMVLDTSEFERLRQGILHDGDGMPVAYRFRQRTDGFERTTDVRARDADGRRQVVHIFDGVSGQHRGISPLAPVLRVVRQYDQLADATLTTVLLQTIFAATVKSSMPSAEAFDGLTGVFDENRTAALEGFSLYMADRMAWDERYKVDLGVSGRINHLFPGEELELHSSNHPHDNYQSFSRGLLREVARGLGVTYEAMTGDYEGATYSSVRMATAAAWQMTLRRRARISAPFYQAAFEAFLDEHVARGWIEFPGGFGAYRAQRPAVVNASWQGPARPTADDLKTAKAQGERLERGITTLAFEAAEYGLDWEEVLEQRAQETLRAAELGVPDPHAPKGLPSAFVEAGAEAVSAGEA